MITLGLIEVRRDVRAGVCVNHIQSHHYFGLRRNSMRFALQPRYGRPGVHIVVTASPVSLAHDVFNDGYLGGGLRRCISVRKSLSLQDLMFLYF